jgi:hypothetical protein
VLGLQPHEDAALAAVRDFDIRRLRRARALRRVLLTVLAVFVAAGAAGQLGGRSSAVAARGGGYELRVTYATVARPGRDAGWKVEIRHPGGFAGPIRLATDSSYLDLFDQSRVRPEPRSSTTDGGSIIWEFDPPSGDILRVTLEAEFEQESMGVHRGATAILGPAGEAVGVGYRSAVLP